MHRIGRAIQLLFRSSRPFPGRAGPLLILALVAMAVATLIVVFTSDDRRHNYAQTVVGQISLSEAKAAPTPPIHPPPSDLAVPVTLRVASPTDQLSATAATARNWAFERVSVTILMAIVGGLIGLGFAAGLLLSGLLMVATSLDQGLLAL